MGPTIKLVTSNGKKVEICDKMVPMLPAIFRIVRGSNSENCDVIELVLISVDSTILEKVLQWATHHMNDQIVSSTNSDAENEEFDGWEISFIQEQSTDVLMELILASQYLEIKRLGDLASEWVARIIKANTAERNRQIFGAEAMDILESGLNKMI